MLSTTIVAGGKTSGGGSGRGSLMTEENFDASLPFRHYNSMMKTLSALPTLPVAEWMFRYLLVACAMHARRNGTGEELATGLLSSLITSYLSRRLMRRDDAMYPAQATVMLDVRTPLFLHEMNAVTMYIAATAARQYYANRKSSTIFAQAALTGVLCHVFQLPAQVNGPRFLWWTFHDTNPAVRERVMNVPVSSLLHVITSGLAYSLVTRWLSSTSASLTETLNADYVRYLPESNRAVVQAGAAFFDGLKARVLTRHPLARVALGAALVAPSHALLSALAQILALDTLGTPTSRSYKLALAACASFALGLHSSGRGVGKEGPPAKTDAALAASVIAYFATQTAVSLTGEEAKHVSTGLHQPYGRAGLLRRDFFGNHYEARLSGEGPVGASRFDYVVEGCLRLDLEAELSDKREALGDCDRFLAAARRRVGETEEALRECTAWSSTPVKRMPALKGDEFVREMDATNSIRLARIKSHLETRLERAKAERDRLVSYHDRILTKVAKLEDALEQGSLDPAGNAVHHASEFGPHSVWYTIRGVGAPGEEDDPDAALLMRRRMMLNARRAAGKAAVERRYNPAPEAEEEEEGEGGGGDDLAEERDVLRKVNELKLEEKVATVFFSVLGAVLFTKALVL